MHYLSDDKRSIVVLGSGAYRIGSSVEFDWCGVQALNTIRKEGFRSVMINYNPETVSTDYDMCDRLYFDELTFERVLDILGLGMSARGYRFYGRTDPEQPGHPSGRSSVFHILGTTAKSIDNAEDREKFSAMLDRIGVDQPRVERADQSMDDINAFIDKVGFPVLVRPIVRAFGCAAMNVCSNQDELERFLQLAANVSQKHPVVVSKFLSSMPKRWRWMPWHVREKSWHTPSASTSSLPACIREMPQSSSLRRNCMWRRYAASRRFPGK